MSKRFIKASCKAIQWSYWEFFNIDISKEDFMSLPTNDAWYIKLTLSKNKDWANQYWNTHYLVLNEYKWKQNTDDAKPIDDYWTPVTNTDDDLPF